MPIVRWLWSLVTAFDDALDLDWGGLGELDPAPTARPDHH